MISKKLCGSRAAPPMSAPSSDYALNAPNAVTPIVIKQAKSRLNLLASAVAAPPPAPAR